MLQVEELAEACAEREQKENDDSLPGGSIEYGETNMLCGRKGTRLVSIGGTSGVSDCRFGSVYYVRLAWSDGTCKWAGRSSESSSSYDYQELNLTSSRVTQGHACFLGNNLTQLVILSSSGKELRLGWPRSGQDTKEFKAPSPSWYLAGLKVKAQPCFEREWWGLPREAGVLQVTPIWERVKCVD